jgi:large subunit ribosomal protein L9
MGLVKLILSDDMGKLGAAGDLVSVKPGYARNYLLPQGKAVVATESRVKELEHQKRVITDRMAKELKDVEALQKRIESISLEFEAQAGEEGKLFGSVTAAQVAEQLAEKGLKIDRRKLVLDEPIKTLGEHKVAVRLRNELSAEVTVNVTAAE